jgi:hypothetical protein
VNAAAAVADSVLGFVTETATAGPAAPAGVTAVNEVELTHTTLVADAPPIETASPTPASNPVPVIVIEVPPAGAPSTGETAVTVGVAGGTYV